MLETLTVDAAGTFMLHAKLVQAIDSLPEVAFWLRNVAKHPESFWLPTASGKFYPDFVVRLTGGRIMVIAYKGALLAGSGVDDTNEKRVIGRLGERDGAAGRLFVMVEKQLGGLDMREHLRGKMGRKIGTHAP